MLPLRLVAAIFFAGCSSASPAVAPSDLSQNAPPIEPSGMAAESTSPPLGAAEGSSRGAPTRANNAPKADSGATGARHAPADAATDDLPRGTLVLQVGDSFAGALGVPLGARLRAKGLRSVLKFQTSSYVPTWASGTDLPEYVTHYNPDLVLITLGANEFDLSAPETRAGAVRRLVQHLGGRPCVWITPPRWKQDSGILAVIQANSPPCRFLDSDTIVHDLERKPDKIHPSDGARELWADAVLAWLVRERNPRGARPWELEER